MQNILIIIAIIVFNLRLIAQLWQLRQQDREEEGEDNINDQSDEGYDSN